MPKNKTPRIVSFSSIKPASKNISMIHFNRKEWGKLQPNIKAVKISTPPKRGLKLEFIPDPEGGVTIYPQCDSGPDNSCQVVSRLTPQGVTMQCRCRSAQGHVGSGTLDSPANPKPSCRVLLTRNSLRCISYSNPPCTNCRLRQTTIAGRLMIYCSCG